MLGSEQPCGRIPEEHQWALSTPAPVLFVPRKILYDSEHDSLALLSHSVALASYPPILGGGCLLPQGAFSRWDGMTDMASVSQLFGAR